MRNIKEKTQRSQLRLAAVHTDIELLSMWVCGHACDCTVSECLCVAPSFTAAGSSLNWELDVGKL